MPECESCAHQHVAWTDPPCEGCGGDPPSGWEAESPAPDEGGELVEEESCAVCLYSTNEDYRPGCSGVPPEVCVNWAPDDVAVLKADLAAAQHRIACLESDCDALRDENVKLDVFALAWNEKACEEHKRAEKLAGALARYCPPECREKHKDRPCFGSMGDGCENIVARNALAEYRKGTE